MFAGYIQNSEQIMGVVTLLETVAQRVLSCCTLQSNDNSNMSEISTAMVYGYTNNVRSN